MSEQQTLFMKSVYRPLRIERAEGPYLFTDDGQKILDAASGAVVVNIGQGREEIAQLAVAVVVWSGSLLKIGRASCRERVWIPV